MKNPKEIKNAKPIPPTKTSPIKSSSELNALKKRMSLYIFLGLFGLIIATITVYFVIFNSINYNFVENNIPHNSTSQDDEDNEEVTNDAESTKAAKEEAERKLKLERAELGEKYETTILNDQSTGAIHFIYKNYNVDNLLSYRFIFTDESTGVTKTLTENLYHTEKCGNFTCDVTPESPLLFNNEIYFLYGRDDNYLLKKFNPYSGETSTIPLEYDKTAIVDPISNYSEAKSVHSFLIYGDILYYLTGTNCNFVPASCIDSELHSYNIKTQKNQLLAKNLTTGGILGIDKAGTNLILYRAYGDAGCNGGVFEKYNFSTKKASNLFEYNYCFGIGTDYQYPPVDDNTNNEQYAKAQAVYNNIGGPKPVLRLNVTNGKISIPTEDNSSDIAENENGDTTDYFSIRISD